jgi:hypothetical protein
MTRSIALAAALALAAPAEALNFRNGIQTISMSLNGRLPKGTDAAVERLAIQGITLPSGTTLRAE